MKPLTLFLFAVILPGSLVVTAPAYAYLDPGTGSMLVQMLLGGVAGVLMIGKLYWARTKAFFGRRSRQNVRQEPASDIDAE